MRFVIDDACREHVRRILRHMQCADEDCKRAADSVKSCEVEALHKPIMLAAKAVNDAVKMLRKVVGQ